MRVQVPRAGHEAQADAIAAVAADYNARVGCQALTVTEAKSVLRVRWATEAEAKWYARGAAGWVEEIAEPFNGVTNNVVNVNLWIADKWRGKELTVEETTRLWIQLVAMEAKLKYLPTSPDPNSLRSGHGTTAPDPAGALLVEFPASVVCTS